MRFEERQDPLPVRCEPVLVAVQDVCARILVDCLDDREQRLRREDVVVIHESDEVPTRKPESGVRVRADASVLRKMTDIHARVARCELIEQADARGIGARVRHAELELAVSLSEHGLGHFPKHEKRRVEHRDDDGDERLDVEPSGPLALVGELRLARIVPHSPQLVSLLYLIATTGHRHGRRCALARSAPGQTARPPRRPPSARLR